MEKFIGYIKKKKKVVIKYILIFVMPTRYIAYFM